MFKSARSRAPQERRTRPSNGDGKPDSIDQARDAFAAAWQRYLPRCTEADFEAWRDHQAWTAENIAASLAASGCRRIGDRMVESNGCDETDKNPYIDS